MKKTIAVVLLALLVTTACVPVPKWVRPIIDLVVYRGPNTPPLTSVPPGAEKLSCAVVVSQSASERTGYYHVMDLDWRKYLAVDPGAYARACSVPAYNAARSVPVLKAGGWANNNTSAIAVTLLMETNPNPATLSGSGYWTYPMNPLRFAAAYIQSWAAAPNLAINPR